MRPPAYKIWRPQLDAASHGGMLVDVPCAANSSSRDLLLRGLSALDWLGYELSDLALLSDVHLQALARYWRHSQIPEPKLLARLRAIHAFIEALTDRQPRVSVSQHLECAGLVVSACRVASKVCWSTIGIDVDGVLARIEGRDPYVAMQLRLQRSFRLNTATVQTLSPHRADRGHTLVVLDEQGSRPRRIPVDTAEKRATLDAAKRLAPYAGATLHAPGTPESERLSRYHDVCIAAGFSLRVFRIKPWWIRGENALADVLAGAVHAGAFVEVEQAWASGAELRRIDMRSRSATVEMAG